MSRQSFFNASGILFLVVGATHFIRAVYGWEFEVASNYTIPVWLSWLAFVVTWYLAYWAFRLKK